MTEVEDDSDVKVYNGYSYKVFAQNPGPSQTGWDSAPDSIRVKSHEYLVENFGLNYFSDHFTLYINQIIPIGARSEITSEMYVVAYLYEITIGDFVTKKIVATFQDTIGIPVRTEGVTNRVINPELGMPFDATPERVVQAAITYGLKQGEYPWTLRFYFFYGEVNRYVWSVSNSLSESGGRTLVIDASNSSVIFDGGTIVIP
ncbi:MAG: hypothetical protein IIA59_13470 [Candidatus Marinimicrobia bacterium]|nr:hypothetical protein [Candidatus Neomarinimicrobiota bacterium]